MYCFLKAGNSHNTQSRVEEANAERRHAAVLLRLGVPIIDKTVNDSCMIPEVIDIFSFSSSGKSSLMNTVSTPLELTMATAISNWRGSTCTTMRLLEANMYPGPFSLIWNPVPWIPSGRDHTDKYSVLITLFLVNLELATTGPRVTTQKV